MDEITKFKDLVKENRLDEAKAILARIIEKPLTDEERGAVLTNLAMFYIEVSNSMDKEFLDNYEKTMAAIKKIESSQKGLEDKQKLASIRKSLEQFIQLIKTHEKKSS